MDLLSKRRRITIGVLLTILLVGMGFLGGRALVLGIGYLTDRASRVSEVSKEENQPVEKDGKKDQSNQSPTPSQTQKQGSKENKNEAKPQQDPFHAPYVDVRFNIINKNFSDVKREEGGFYIDGNDISTGGEFYAKMNAPVPGVDIQFDSNSDNIYYVKNGKVVAYVSPHFDSHGSVTVREFLHGLGHEVFFKVKPKIGKEQEEVSVLCWKASNCYLLIPVLSMPGWDYLDYEVKAFALVTDPSYSQWFQYLRR